MQESKVQSVTYGVTVHQKHVPAKMYKLLIESEEVWDTKCKAWEADLNKEIKLSQFLETFLNI